MDVHVKTLPFSSLMCALFFCMVTSFGCPGGQGEGEEGEGESGEGEGEDDELAAAISAFCAKATQCDLVGDNCVANYTQFLPFATSVDDPICQGYYDAILAFMGCVAGAECVDLVGSGSACDAEQDALFVFIQQGTYACHQGTAPAFDLTIRGEERPRRSLSLAEQLMHQAVGPNSAEAQLCAAKLRRCAQVRLGVSCDQAIAA